MSKISPSQKSRENIVVNFHGENDSSSKFESALRPLIVCLILLTGVDITRIKATGKENKIASVSFFLYGILLLFFNYVCTGIFNYVYLKQKFQNYPVTIDGDNSTNVSKKGQSSNTEHIHMLTVFFVAGWEYVFICGTHLCFFVLQTRFKKLWNALMFIEKEMKLVPFIYRYIRKSLWIGGLIIPIVRNLSNVQNAI